MVVVDNSVGTDNMVSDSNPRGQFVTHICYCSVDTELIDGTNLSICMTTEVYISASFDSQRSSFESTGSTEHGMSAFTEVDHHVLSDMIPFAIRFIRVSSVPRGACSPWAEGGVVREGERRDATRSFLGSRRLSAVVREF